MYSLLKAGVFTLSIFFLVLIYDSPGLAQEKEMPGQSDITSQKEKSGFNPGATLASIFRDHISRVDGDRCPSIPNCSSYSVKAFKKHGFFVGWMMMVDRLIHEGSEETRVSPTVYSNGKWKIFDPIENNDFWWYTEDKKPN